MQFSNSQIYFYRNAMSGVCPDILHHPTLLPVSAAVMKCCLPVVDTGDGRLLIMVNGHLWTMHL